METQQVDAHVSLLSRMNAFYGIPNLSQETTAAVQQGAPAPEVYTPEDNQLLQASEDANKETTSPVESFFTEATEQVEISEQAVGLQQQTQAVNESAVSADVTNTLQAAGEAQPESAAATPANSLNSEPETANEARNAPPATTALNAEAPTSLDSIQNTAQPASAYNDQSGPAIPSAAGGGGVSDSNAVQPGALFSALG